jgi:hypothetical protein
MMQCNAERKRPDCLQGAAVIMELRRLQPGTYRLFDSSLA